ncbi:MAG: polysaccharide deacetylase family protein [Thermodesulfobacteriota bacterium]
MKKGLYWAGIGVLGLFLGACAGLETKTGTHPQTAAPIIQERVFEGFVAVIAGEGDTWSSLAVRYLNDPGLDWLISEFNGGGNLEPGRGVIIPRKPFGLGGLERQGFQTVPVLSYHQFSNQESNRMTVTKAAFSEQMNFLKENGYRVVTLEQLFDFLDFNKPLPPKSVVITIDDGWKSAYEIAFPILKTQGFPATLFVYTDLISGSEKTLSWDQVKEMAENGLDIQCHTKSHLDLTAVEKNVSFRDYFSRIEEDLSACTSMIKKKLDRKTDYLAYPFGNTNQLVISLLIKQGYRGAFTVKRGGNPFFVHNFRVNRSMIYGDYTLEKFKKNLAVFQEEVLP